MSGSTALMDVARLGGPPEPWHLGFLLGPRINAGGRIGRADARRRSAAAGRPDPRPRALAAELDRLNRERQVIELATLAEAEAEAMAALGLEEKGAVVVTAAEGWHPGVVGLVAARLKERYGRPAFAIALEPGGIGTGSGRSDRRRRSRPRGAAGGERGPAHQGRRPRHGGRRDLAQGRRSRPSAPISKTRSPLPSRRRGAKMRLLIDGALSAAGADWRCGGKPRARRTVRRRQSGAGDRAAGPYDRLCRRGRPGARAGAAALRRRRDHQRDCVSGRRAEARRGACTKAADRRCMPPARSRSIAGTASSGCSCGSSTSRRPTRASASSQKIEGRRISELQFDGLGAPGGWGLSATSVARPEMPQWPMPAGSLRQRRTAVRRRRRH